MAASEFRNVPDRSIDWAAEYDQMAEPVVLLDHDFRIVEANTAAGQIAGLARQQLRGRRCYRVLGCGESPPGDCPHAAAMRGEKTRRSTVPLETLSSRCSATATPIFERNGETLGSLVVATLRRPAAVTRNARILLADDDPHVGAVTARLLQRLGYRVTLHADARRAWQCFRDDSDGFDLVMTDQTMPHLSGLELAEKILSVRPDLPVVLYTAYGGVLSKKRVDASGIRAVISKPASFSALAEIIGNVVAGE